MLGKDRTRSCAERYGAPCNVIDADPRVRRRVVLKTGAGSMELAVAPHGASDSGATRLVPNTSRGRPNVLNLATQAMEPAGG